jgi:hypothetical protein
MPGHSGLLQNCDTGSAAKKSHSTRKFNTRPVVIFAPFYFPRLCRRGKTNGPGQQTTRGESHRAGVVFLPQAIGTEEVTVARLRIRQTHLTLVTLILQTRLTLVTLILQSSLNRYRKNKTHKYGIKVFSCNYERNIENEVSNRI